MQLGRQRGIPGPLHDVLHPKFELSVVFISDPYEHPTRVFNSISNNNTPDAIVSSNFAPKIGQYNRMHLSI
eukprot:2479219-Rhodomonas_salina.1